MILRIVKMTFKAEGVQPFLQTFDHYKAAIRSQPGCHSLVLLHDVDDPCVFFTHSYWVSADDLERYRRSDTFQEVWPLTKVHFDAKPQAWSLQPEWGTLPPPAKSGL